MYDNNEYNIKVIKKVHQCWVRLFDQITVLMEFSLRYLETNGDHITTLLQFVNLLFIQNEFFYKVNFMGYPVNWTWNLFHKCYICLIKKHGFASEPLYPSN